MLKQVLETISEEFNEEGLLAKLDEAKTEEELLEAARRLVVLRKSGNWLKLKIQALYEKDTGRSKWGII